MVMEASRRAFFGGALAAAFAPLLPKSPVPSAPFTVHGTATGRWSSTLPPGEYSGYILKSEMIDGQLHMTFKLDANELNEWVGQQFDAHVRLAG